MKYRVLAADDERELLDVLELFLEREEIGLIKAGNGQEALELFEKESPHMVLLDIMMPGPDGFEVLRRIRGRSRIPAIMLTARVQDYDKVLGLELGADDYITKPYNPIEVSARIKAQLRRYYEYGGSVAKESEVIRLFNLELRPQEGILLKNGEEVPLTGTELKILELLMKSPGRIFTKQQIFDYAWEEPYIGDNNTIMVHISNIRAKIEENPRQPVLVKTVKGLGYKCEMKTAEKHNFIKPNANRQMTR